MEACLKETVAWCLTLHTGRIDARELKGTQGLQSSRESICVLRLRGSLQKCSKHGLLSGTPPSLLFPVTPGIRCWDAAPIRLSPRMARRFLVFPEGGSFERGEWVKANCWLQHVRPINSHSGTTGVDAGAPAKCNQAPPVARRRVVQWGAGGIVVNLRCCCNFIRWILGGEEGEERRKCTALANQLANRSRFLKNSCNCLQGRKSTVRWWPAHTQSGRICDPVSPWSSMCHQISRKKAWATPPLLCV